tara:strand:+ start:14762 stop:14971 length:210 start_codon:yes stop_codon:yes gene_type:complete
VTQWLKIVNLEEMNGIAMRVLYWHLFQPYLDKSLSSKYKLLRIKLALFFKQSSAGSLSFLASSIDLSIT